MKTKPSRSDILIFGGGISAISAAISAAQGGSTVYLVCPHLVLGGCVGENYQIPLDLPSGTNHSFFRESGLWENLVTFIRSENKEGTFSGQARALLAFVKQFGNITPMLGYHCLDARLNSSQNRIESCILINHSEGFNFLHRAQFFLDCSDGAELSKLANAPGEDRVSMNPSASKSPKVIYRTSALVEILSSAKEIPFSLPEWISTPWEKNSINARISFLESLKKNLCGFHRIEWMSEEIALSGSDELSWTAWDFVKNRSHLKEVSKNLFINRIIPIPQVSKFRGSGDYQLTQDDIYQLKTFEDSVAISRAPLSTGKSSEASMFGKIVLPGSFEIPLRSLYSSKIKNLLWAGPHASFDSEVAQSVNHPPTLSQLGTAVGYCAAKCITEKRLPRTLAKKGHIEGFRSGLAKLNHKVNHYGLEDELDLTAQSEVSSSTTWSQKNLQELPRRPGMRTKSCLIQFPLTSGTFENISLLIRSDGNQRFTARLLEGSGQLQQIPGNCLATEITNSKEAGDQWIFFQYQTKLASKGWHFIELSSEKEFSMIEAENAPVGYLIQYPRKSLQVEGENPYSEYCIPPDDSPTPHRCAILNITPTPHSYKVSELISPNTRPYHTPELWISQPTRFTYPEFVEFHWPKPVTVSRIELFFDPSFGYFTPPYPKVSGSPYPSSLVKEYKIYLTNEKGKSSLLFEVTNNNLSHRVHLFEGCIVKSMEIEILSTHGLDRAQIFRIAAYE